MTSTATAANETEHPTSIKEVRAGEVARLDDALAASGPALAELKLELADAQQALSAALAELAKLEQQASTLQQELCQAKTGPQRHKIEGELNQNLIEQGPLVDRKLTAAERVAVKELALKRETALAERTRGELARADAALTQAREEAATATVWRAKLPGIVTAVTTGATGLEDHEETATGRMAVLLGGPTMLELVETRVKNAGVDVEKRADTLAAAEAEVRAAGTARSAIDGKAAETWFELTRARSAARDAVEAAPARLAAAAAVLDKVINFPALSPAEQDAITKAAEKVPPGAESGAEVDAWEVTVPGPVFALAIELLDAKSSLEALREIEADPLLENLDDAETAYATALAAQLKAQRDQDTATDEAAAAGDEITAYEATAAERRLSLVRGDH